MIYILHGENLPAIRAHILKLQQENSIGTKKELKLEDTTALEVAELVCGIDMFGAKAMLVLDVSKMGRTNVDDFISALSQVPEDFLLVIFSSKTLSKANAFVKAAPKLGVKVLPFKQFDGSNVFKFVDAVFEGNRKAMYKELRQLLLAGEDEIYIFTMLVYGLRNISYAKFDSSAFNRIPPFVKSKVKKQAEAFSEEALTAAFARFYELDKKAKIGEISPSVIVPVAVEFIASLR